MEKRGKRALQGIETRERIIEVAIESIRAHGYDNVTVKDICRSLDLTIGAFYHHFKNKDDIIMEILKRHDEFFLKQAQDYLTADNILENIIIYLTLLPMRIVEDNDIDLTIKMYCLLLTKSSDFPLSSQRGIAQQLIKLITEGQRRKEITEDEDADTIQEELLLLTRGIIFNWAECKGNYNLVNKVRKMCRNYLRSYALSSTI